MFFLLLLFYKSIHLLPHIWTDRDELRSGFEERKRERERKNQRQEGIRRRSMWLNFDWFSSTKMVIKKERFAKLLLGEDMSRSRKGVCTVTRWQLSK
jgi:hypothetical protein